MPVEGETDEEMSVPGEAPAMEASPMEAPPPEVRMSDAERIAALEAEVAELTDRHARAVADLQNYRRRSEERWAERSRATLADSIARSLPVLDDLDRALASVDEEPFGQQWVEGIRLVQQKFHEMLSGVGVEQIESDAAAFDPLVHEAVSFGPGPEGRVIALVRAGYRIEDHVVRPAQVVVGDGSAAAAVSDHAGPR